MKTVSSSTESKVDLRKEGHQNEEHVMTKASLSSKHADGNYDMTLKRQRSRKYEDDGKGTGSYDGLEINVKRSYHMLDFDKFITTKKLSNRYSNTIITEKVRGLIAELSRFFYQ